MADVDPAALTMAHLAVEDRLIEMRDSRLSVIGPRNGFVVNEKDGSPSPMLRMGTREGLELGIAAYLAALPHPECEHGCRPYPDHPCPVGCVWDRKGTTAYCGGGLSDIGSFHAPHAWAGDPRERQCPGRPS